MKFTIGDLLIGDLVRLDNKRVIHNFSPSVEMTFIGHILCVRDGNYLYDPLTNSFYEEMKRDERFNLDVDNLLKGSLYIKDVEPVRIFIYGYSNKKRLKKKYLQNIKNDLKELGLPLIEKEKILLRKIK